MFTKNYSIATTIIAIIAVIAAIYFYSQTSGVKSQLLQNQYTLSRMQEELTQTKAQLGQAKTETDKLRLLAESGLANSKAGAGIMQSSLETFLVAGDARVAVLAADKADEVSAKIQNLASEDDKRVLAKAWTDFVKSKKLSDFFAFEKSLVQTVSQNLENIH